MHVSLSDIETKIIDGKKVSAGPFLSRLQGVNLFNSIADAAQVNRALAKHAVYCYMWTGNANTAVRLLAHTKQLTEEQAEHVVNHVVLAFVGVM